MSSTPIAIIRNGIIELMTTDGTPISSIIPNEEINDNKVLNKPKKGVSRGT
jgi:hypothetical protein